MSIGNLILGVSSVTVSYLIHYDSLLQNTTDIVTKCDRSLLQNVSGFLLQNATLLSGIPQRSIKGPRLFNIYICDLFFDIIKIDIANYADDTTSYALDSKLENIVKLLQESDYLKANPDKCHLLVNTTGNIRISVRNEQSVTGRTKSYLVFVLIAIFVLMTT